MSSDALKKVFIVGSGHLGGASGRAAQLAHAMLISQGMSAEVISPQEAKELHSGIVIEPKVIPYTNPRTELQNYAPHEKKKSKPCQRHEYTKQSGIWACRHCKTPLK